MLPASILSRVRMPKANSARCSAPVPTPWEDLEGRHCRPRPKRPARPRPAPGRVLRQLSKRNRTPGEPSAATKAPAALARSAVSSLLPLSRDNNLVDVDRSRGNDIGDGRLFV